MKKHVFIIPVFFLSVICVATGKDLFKKDEPVETNKTMELTKSAIQLESGKKYELSFLARTNGKYTIEENERIRLMNLGEISSRVCIKFYDAKGKELKKTDIDLPVITQKFLNYVRVFYPPPASKALKIFLLPAKEADIAVKRINISTDLKGREAECINIHPAFEYGDLNFYGYSSGYGGGFYTRPDGKTVWNSGFTGTTPAFPVKGDVSYDFCCRGKKSEPKSFIYLQCYNAEGGKPFKTMKYGVSEKGDIEKINMPAGTVSVQLTCYYVIIEEFKVTESRGDK